MILRDIEEAEAALARYIPLVTKITGKQITLERMWPLLQLVGNPHERLRAVHVAGTSGKTSTAYYMAALLRATGKKVGLTVSPHLDSITERLQINGQPISETTFCQELGEFLGIVEKSSQQPTYYELMCAFVFWFFDRQQMDYVVVETGLGGLHDATNVLARADKVCIITDIGFDHTEVLGSTLPEIATQKIGIVHEHNQVFTYKQTPEIMEVFEKWRAEHQAKLNVVAEQAASGTRLPVFQQRNWQLAKAAYDHLEKRDELQSLTSQALQDMPEIKVPGRMDIKNLPGKTIVMDGAHNAQKMAVFIDSFKQLYPGTWPTVLLSLKQGKDYEPLLPLLAQLSKNIIVTSFKTAQDLPAKSMDPQQLGQALTDSGVQDVQVITDQHEAFTAFMESPEPVGIITGSFYFLGQIRNNEDLA